MSKSTVLDDPKHSGSLSKREGGPPDLEPDYAELVEMSKSIIFKWDAEGKVIWMNEYGMRFFGFSKEEILGRSVYETIVPRVESTGRDLSTLVRDIFENEERYTTNTNENVKKDGTRVWIHWSNRPIKNEKGELVAIISIGTDITNRIKIERIREYELKESRALSRLYGLLISPKTNIGEIEQIVLEEAKGITESSCGFIGRLDPKTREFVVNKIVQEQECVMKGKKIRLNGATDGKPNSLIDYALSSLKAFYTNFPKEHFAYKEVPEWHVTIERLLMVPMHIDGQALGLVALANSRRDYEDRDLEAVSNFCRYFVFGLQKISYEEELVLKEKFYRTLFENAPVPTLLVDEDGNICNINSAFERLLGHTKEGVEGKKTWKEFVHPDDLQRMEFYRSERFSGRDVPKNYEVRFLDKQGGVHDVLVNIAIIPGTRKAIAALLDLTEMKRLQSDLKRYSEELERYSKHLEELVEERTRELKEKERLAAIGQTATSIAHDLKSPLQVLVNSIYIIKMVISKLPSSVVEQLKNSGVLEALSRIERQIDYIDRLLSDLEDLSKTIKPEVRSVDLRRFIHESVQSVSIPENIEVNMIFGENEVELDPYLMRRVIVNIIQNAVQAMPKGGKLTIETSKSDSEVCVTIKDTGVGIPKEVLDNLFKPFFTTKVKGTGFGLFNSKRIVEAHGGSISVESDIGKGTTFTIRIPLKKGHW